MNNLIKGVFMGISGCIALWLYGEWAYNAGVKETVKKVTENIDELYKTLKENEEES